MANAVQNRVSSESLQERLKNALSQAREVCGLGESSADCKTAWETVAELGIATKAEKEEQPFFTAYCDAHPGAVECKVYDT